MSPCARFLGNIGRADPGPGAAAFPLPGPAGSNRHEPCDRPVARLREGGGERGLGLRHVPDRPRGSTSRPMGGRLRIAILTHSTDPRGGVVHALALGEALGRLGHEAVVHAPDPTGSGFFRAAQCPVISVAAKPVAGPADALVGARIADYLAHFSTPAACDFDVFHAHCRISGNALATLARRRLIPSFARTVHRIDTFTDPRLAQWEERAILDAGRLLCVSRTWAATLAAEYGARADIVGTGVDAAAFTPEPGVEDDALRRQKSVADGGEVGGVVDEHGSAEAGAEATRRGPRGSPRRQRPLAMGGEFTGSGWTRRHARPLAPEAQEDARPSSFMLARRRVSTACSASSICPSSTSRPVTVTM